MYNVRCPPLNSVRELIRLDKQIKCDESPRIIKTCPHIALQGTLTSVEVYKRCYNVLPG